MASFGQGKTKKNKSCRAKRFREDGREASKLATRTRTPGEVLFLPRPLRPEKKRSQVTPRRSERSPRRAIYTLYVYPNYENKTISNFWRTHALCPDSRFSDAKKKKKNALEGFLIAMTIARGLGLFTWF